MPYVLLFDPANKRLWRLYGDLLRRKIPYLHKRMKDFSIRSNPLQLKYGGSSLSFSNQFKNQLKLRLADGDLEINLEVTPQKPMTLVGNTGKPDRLYYYSFVRNYVKGNIKRNAVYPLEWNIEIPDFNMRLKVRPYFNGQEMPILGHLQAIWEGACIVTGEELLPGYKHEKTLAGKGFMELVGYANRS